MPELPFPDLRAKIIPDTLVLVKVFRRNDMTNTPLDQQINEWVRATGNIVVMPSAPVTTSAEETMAVSYIEAVSNNYDKQAPAPVVVKPKTVESPASVGPPASRPAGPVSAVSLSDGKR